MGNLITNFQESIHIEEKILQSTLGNRKYNA